jgi:hypothetical protein
MTDSPLESSLARAGLDPRADTPEGEKAPAAPPDADVEAVDEQREKWRQWQAERRVREALGLRCVKSPVPARVVPDLIDCAHGHLTAEEVFGFRPPPGTTRKQIEAWAADLFDIGFSREVEAAIGRALVEHAIKFHA